MKCLVVDHYDSFTFNLVDILTQLLTPCDISVQVVNHDDETFNLNPADYCLIVLSPGPGHPVSGCGCVTRSVLDGYSTDSVMPPLLGVCLGMQAIAERFGARVAQAECGPRHGVLSPLKLMPPTSLLPTHCDGSMVVRYHSLEVTAVKPPLRVTAVAGDTGTVMAIEHDNLPIWGVQFHPESVACNSGRDILARAVELRLKPRLVNVSKIPGVHDPWVVAQKMLIADGPSIFLVHNDWYVIANNPDKLFVDVNDEWGIACTAPAGFPLSPPLIAGFRTFEGDDCFHRFSNILLIRNGQCWALNSSSSESILHCESIHSESTHSDPIQLQLHTDPENYMRKVTECLESLQRGDSYELCLTTRASNTTMKSSGREVEMFRALREANPGQRYSCLFKTFGPGSLLLNSPEVFLSATDGYIETRPVKGTRPRYHCTKTDAAAAESLTTCSKDISENLMIVDLCRNDLSKVCTHGSVKVPELFKLETLPHCHQLYSLVRGQLRSSPAEAMDALFPPGSMTGAPKASSVTILKNLELEPRGAYSGAAGWFCPSLNRAELAVVIRSIWLPNEGGVVLGAGGAVVAASDPEAEYREALLKFTPGILALSRVCGRVDFMVGNSTVVVHAPRKDTPLIETTRLTSEGRVWLLHRHLERLRRSALAVFNLKVTIDALLEKIATVIQVSEVVEDSNIDWGRLFDIDICDERYRRLRISLSRDGDVSCEVSDVKDSPPSIIGIAAERVFSRDPNRRVKQVSRCHTTDILMNENDEVAEGSWFNLAVLIDGHWTTPPVCSGALPGTVREELLSRSIIREGSISVSELSSATRIRCFNSLRGVWEATLSA